MAPRTQVTTMSSSTPILKYISQVVEPYGELMRMSNPVGTCLVYFPYLLGSAFSARLSSPSLDLSSLIRINATLLFAAFMLHSLGCSWNDVIDADLDRKVARTKKRPVARGAISPLQAYLFTGAETIVWLYTLSLVSVRTAMWALPLIPPVMLYPFGKRFTNYPGVILGMIKAWGFAVGGIAILSGSEPPVFTQLPEAFAALVCHYVAFTLWMAMADMIYAFQDLKDDLRVGILSMAVRFKDHPKLAIGFMAAVQVGLLCTAGYLVDFGPLYFTASGASCIMLNAWMLWSVDLSDPAQCWWWFQIGSLLMQGAISTGMVGEYLANTQITSWSDNVIAYNRSDMAFI